MFFSLCFSGNNFQKKCCFTTKEDVTIHSVPADVQKGVEWEGSADSSRKPESLWARC